MIKEALSVEDTLKMALEALETAWYHVGTFCPTDKAIELYDDARAAIKEALMSLQDGAQPAVAEQHKQSTTCGEPVAHSVVEPLRHDEYQRRVSVKWVNQPVAGPLYTTPPPVPEAHKRKPLTMQPIIKDGHGVLRFKKNGLVDALYEHGVNTGLGLNELHCMNFTDEDRQQFAQLIGYSVSGYGSLSYVTDEAYEAAEKAAHGIHPTGFKE